MVPAPAQTTLARESVAILAGTFACGELAHAPPTLPWAQLILYGVSSWAGVCCFIGLTRWWGATAAVITTNTRKLLSIVISFVLFPRPISRSFVLSGAAVCLGVAAHAYDRHSARQLKAKPKVA